jgi:hypothetical protein
VVSGITVVGTPRRPERSRCRPTSDLAECCDLDAKQPGVVDADLDPTVLAHDQPQGTRSVDGIADLAEAVIDAESTQMDETPARDVQIASQSFSGFPLTLAALEPNRASNRNDSFARFQQRGDPVVGFDGHDANLAQPNPGQVRGRLVRG